MGSDSGRKVKKKGKREFGAAVVYMGEPRCWLLIAGADCTSPVLDGRLLFHCPSPCIVARQFIFFFAALNCLLISLRFGCENKSKSAARFGVVACLLRRCRRDPEWPVRNPTVPHSNCLRPGGHAPVRLTQERVNIASI